MYQTSKRQPISMELQIHHDLWQKKPQKLYKGIDPKFIQQIEDRNDPSTDYRNKVRGLYSDELQRGLNDFEHRRSKQGSDMEEIKRDYRQKVNGVLGELQKNQQNRKIYYKKCVERQEDRRSRFIDDDKMKETRVNMHVTRNLDTDKFYHIDDTYKQQQKMRNQQRKLIIEIQALDKERERNQERFDKKMEYDQRLKHEDNLRIVKSNQEEIRRVNQSLYFTDLAKLVEEKHKITPISAIPKPNKHNPITNPIQYHIQNPYILKKLQNKYNRTQEGGARY